MSSYILIRYDNEMDMPEIERFDDCMEYCNRFDELKKSYEEAYGRNKYTLNYLDHVKYSATDCCDRWVAMYGTYTNCMHEYIQISNFYDIQDIYHDNAGSAMHMYIESMNVYCDDKELVHTNDKNVFMFKGKNWNNKKTFGILIMKDVEDK